MREAWSQQFAEQRLLEKRAHKEGQTSLQPESCPARMKGEGKADSRSEEPLNVKRSPELLSGSCLAQTVGDSILQWFFSGLLLPGPNPDQPSLPLPFLRLPTLPVPHPSAAKQIEPGVA